MLRLAGEALGAIKGVVAGWVRRVAVEDGEPALEVRQEGSGDQIVVRRGAETLLRVTAEGGIAGPIRIVPQAEPGSAAEGHAYYDSTQKRPRWHDGEAWHGAAASGANADITSLAGLTTPLGVPQGGTGAGSAAGARASLGVSGHAFYGLGRPSVRDLADADAGLKGFFGAFTDGRYGYFVPYNNGQASGKVGRLALRDFSTVATLDLQTSVRKLPFTSGGAYVIQRGDALTGATSGATATVVGVVVTGGTWAGGDAAGDLYLQTQSGSFQSESLNVGANTDVASVTGNSGDSDLRGFLGGFTDGRYGYLVPHYNGAYLGRLVRMDLNDFASVSVLGLDAVDPDLKGFGAGLTDGRYAYLIPCPNGKLARVDLDDFSAATVLNLASIDADLKGFRGGFTDGRYVYLVPHDNGQPFGKVTRVDLQDFASVAVLNLTATDADLKGFCGGFTDGRYGYFVPYNNSQAFGKVARVDLGDFSTVSVLNLASIDADLKGFAGGFTDGRYGYFVPCNNGQPSGKVARVDLNDFSTVAVRDFTLEDADLKGFFGGFSDGRCGYLAPSNNGAVHGHVVRIPLHLGGNL